MNRAKADILIEVVWNINRRGPKRSVTYTLRGVEAYTNKQVAATQGTGEPSMAADVYQRQLLSRTSKAPVPCHPDQ